jgi:hypothetical protein
MKTEINSKVIDDLDALYFFDKIEMRSNSQTPSKIPRLDLKYFSQSTNKPKKSKIVK